MTVEECAKMYEQGISLEVIHKMHGDTITCEACKDDKVRDKNWKKESEVIK
jgi:hypothetical protein